MTRESAPTSSYAACCWIPLFALRCEEARHPELAAQPCALLASDDHRRVWQVSPLARKAGVKAGLTISQAIGLCPALQLCEPDPVHYDQQFGRLLTMLGTVSPVIEPAELGRVFVGMDGLEGLYGGQEGQAEAIRMRIAGCEIGNRSAGADSAFNTPHSAFRLGFGLGKFVSWVAAARARPGHAVIVPPGEEKKFLAAQPLAVLPLDPDTHRRLRQLGLKTLGDLTALPEAAVVSQFGRAGRRLWRLAAGVLAESVMGREVPEPIVAALTFFSPVTDLEMLTQALAQLIERALKHPRRAGWRVRLVRVRAALEHGTSWMIEAVLKEPSADRSRILAPLKTRLDLTPPMKAVERLAVEFGAFTPGTDELQLFARDANAAARAGRLRALRHAVQEIKLRLRQSPLYHIIEVQPWSRIPERRYALIDYEP
jgi:nucleotidyltransferase/DNA polymerase involved in DNA repair